MAINTKYQIKVYDKLGNFKTNLKTGTNGEVIGDVNFTENINSGQGSLNLGIKREYYDDTFLQGDIVEIRISNSENLSGTAKFSGIIEQIERNEDINGTSLVLSIYGVFTALNDILYDNGGGKVFSKTDDPANILKEIIDNFNSNYGSLASDVDNLTGNIIRYTVSSIDTFGSTVDLDFDYDDSLTAIKKVLEVSSNFYWFVDRNGIFYFKEKPSTPVHRLTFDKNIININNRDTKKDLGNKLYLERKGGITKVYDDIASQTTYGIKEVRITNSDLVNETTQDEFANTYFTNNAEISQQIQISIKQTATDNIKPGDTIKTLNTNNPINNLQVVRISYEATETILNLDRFVGIGETIIKS